MCSRPNVDFVLGDSCARVVPFFRLLCAKMAQSENYIRFLFANLFSTIRLLYAFHSSWCIIAEVAQTLQFYRPPPPPPLPPSFRHISHTCTYTKGIAKRCAFCAPVKFSLWCLWTWQFIFSINFTGLLLVSCNVVACATQWMSVYLLYSLSFQHRHHLPLFLLTLSLSFSYFFTLSPIY